MPPHFHLSLNASDRNSSNQNPCSQREPHRNVFSGGDNSIVLKDMGSHLHNQSFKTRFESGNSSSSQSSAPIVPRGGNLKSSLESLTSGDQQQRLSGLPPPPRKTVTFKGDVQTIQCSPEEEHERRCWRHQVPKRVSRQGKYF